MASSFAAIDTQGGQALSEEARAGHMAVAHLDLSGQLSEAYGAYLSWM